MNAVRSGLLADTVSIDPLSGECKLTIFEYMPWNDSLLSELQNRINACLQFVESGEIYLAYPQTQNRDFVIDIRCIYAPDRQAQDFLVTAQQALDEAGYLLRYAPLGSSYADDTKAP